MYLLPCSEILLLSSLPFSVGAGGGGSGTFVVVVVVVGVVVDVVIVVLGVVVVLLKENFEFGALFSDFMS